MCMLETGKQKLHETKTDKGQQVPQQDNSFMAYSYTHKTHETKIKVVPHLGETEMDNCTFLGSSSPSSCLPAQFSPSSI